MIVCKLATGLPMLLNIVTVIILRSIGKTFASLLDSVLVWTTFYPRDVVSAVYATATWLAG